MPGSHRRSAHDQLGAHRAKNEALLVGVFETEQAREFLDGKATHLRDVLFDRGQRDLGD